MRNITLSVPDDLVEWFDAEAALERRNRSNLITVALEAYRARRQTSILLTPGRHVIDGQAVDVPGSGDLSHVWHPLRPGKHVVDDRVVIVHALPGTHPHAATAAEEVSK